MREDARTVRYYCTAGGGMEPFLAQEVKLKLRATEVEYIPGRVFFSCSTDLQEVMRLKSAERLFLLLSRAPPIALPTNPAKASDVVQQSIVGNPDIWNQAFCTWSSLQAELSCSQGRGHKRKRDGEQEREERVGGGASGDVGSERAHTHSRSTRDHRDGGGSVSNQTPPTFRVSCRCSGAVARCCNSQNLSRIIGVAISRELGWKADLREPILEVNVYLSDDYSVTGIPLIRHPLASRNYMKHTGLRSTIAWAMTSLCPMEEASVILDPMCGVGTILLEASQECSHAVFIGMDSEEGQLQKAVENVAAAGQEGRIVLVQSSCTDIPLPTASVDVVLCDVPFGRKFSCSGGVSAALPRILAEIERVLHEGGCLIILLSLQLSAHIKKLLKSDSLTPKALTHEQDEDPQGRPSGLGDPKGRPSGLGDPQGRPSGLEMPSTEAPKDSRGLNHPALSSLHLQNTHRVSLGSTDAVIHTYSKITTLTH